MAKYNCPVDCNFRMSPKTGSCKNNWIEKPMLHEDDSLPTCPFYMRPLYRVYDKADYNPYLEEQYHADRALRKAEELLVRELRKVYVPFRVID